MSHRVAKRIRAAVRYRECHTRHYEPLQLHHIAQFPQYETHQRVVREMGPVSPGAPTNLRLPMRCWWVPRSGCRRVVVSRTVEKIRYQSDGKTPLHPVMFLNVETGAYEQRYEMIPIAKPVRLKEGTARQVYRLLKHLQRRVGLAQVLAGVERETA